MTSTHSIGLSGTDVVHLRPPYPEEWPGLYEGNGELVLVDDLVPGSAIGLTIRSGDWARQEETVRHIRSTFPAAAIAIHLSADITRPGEFAIQAGRHGVAAVLMERDRVDESLRRQLTCPDRLNACAVDWIEQWVHERGGSTLNPRLRYTLKGIFANAHRFKTAGALLQDLRIAPGSTRFWFRKKRLPPTSVWIRLARSLHVSLRMQRYPGEAVQSVATALGYCDHSAVTHATVKSFGLPPTVVREAPGWEWLLDRWARENLPGGAHA